MKGKYSKICVDHDEIDDSKNNDEVKVYLLIVMKSIELTVIYVKKNEQLIEWKRAKNILDF